MVYLTGNSGVTFTSVTKQCIESRLGLENLGCAWTDGEKDFQSKGCHRIQKKDSLRVCRLNFQPCKQKNESSIKLRSNWNCSPDFLKIYFPDSCWNSPCVTILSSALPSGGSLPL